MEKKLNSRHRKDDEKKEVKILKLILIENN